MMIKLLRSGLALLRRNNASFNADLEKRLARYGARISNTSGPGVANFGGFRVRYSNPLVFYMELKDIFHHRIYDFTSVRSNPRVLDCGSHIGMSILYAKKNYPGSRITAFEPDSSAREILKWNLRANGCEDVELVDAALSPSTSPQYFLSAQDGSHLLTRETAGATVVQTCLLSHYLHESIDFLKMNIEGSELEVLNEARSQLSNVRQMVIEYHGFPSQRQYLHDLLQVISDSGFRYLVHDFDSETNSGSKPPFRLESDTRFFLLIFAKQESELLLNRATVG